METETQSTPMTRQWGLLPVLGTAVLSSGISVAVVFNLLRIYPLWNVEPPVRVVDLVQVAAAVSKMAKTPEELTRLLKESALSIEAIKKRGTIVIDTRTAVGVPEALLIHPGDLIAGAEDVRDIPPLPAFAAEPRMSDPTAATPPQAKEPTP